MPEVVYSEETLKTQDGIDLFCRVWLPGAGRVRAVVVICHGQGEHSGRYAHVAQFFVERGYAVYAYDLRGQGKSGGVRGHVDRWTQYYDDLWLVIRTAIDRKSVV